MARALTRRLAVLGCGEQLPFAVARLSATASAARLAMILDFDGARHGRWPRGVAILRDFAQLEGKIQAGEVDQVVIAMPGRSGARLRQSVRGLRHLGVDVAWIPDLPPDGLPVLGTDQLGDVPLVRLLERPATRASPASADSCAAPAWTSCRSS